MSDCGVLVEGICMIRLVNGVFGKICFFYVLSIRDVIIFE